MKIEIKNRWSGVVLFELECESLRDAVLKALATGANLRSANLSGAYLSGADLSGANLSGANLRSANLRSADLSGANLSGANLRSANLRSANLRSANLRSANLSGANLRSANLSGANLRSANLSGAYLSGANLSGAYLSGADLSGADLRPIRADFYDVLSAAPLEVRALREALIEGRVNGSTYEGKCACLIGTIANARHCNHLKIPDLEPDSSRPAERFFLGIKEGDTPENSQFAKIAVEWIDNWKPLHFIPEVTLQVT